MAPNQVVDKEYLYGDFRKGERRSQTKQDRRARFHERLAHKAVDMAMPDDEDETVINANRTGIGGWALAALGAALLAPNVIGSVREMLRPETPAAQPQAPVAATAPADSEYDVRFYDAHGNLIDLRPLSDFKPEEPGGN